MTRRVEIGPHHDLWMRGAQFGTVINTEQREGRTLLVVKMDHPQVKKPIRVWEDETKELP